MKHLVHGTGTEITIQNIKKEKENCFNYEKTIIVVGHEKKGFIKMALKCKSLQKLSVPMHLKYIKHNSQ